MSRVLEKKPPTVLQSSAPQDPAWSKWFGHLFIGGCRPTATNQKLRSDDARDKPKGTKNENYLRDAALVFKFRALKFVLFPWTLSPFELSSDFAAS